MKHWSTPQSLRRSRGAPVCFLRRLSLSELLVVGLICSCAQAAESTVIARFRSDVQPLLAKYCYDCHGDGMDKGKVAFDELKSEEQLLAKPELWFTALKNLRANLMPPEKKPRPSLEEKERIANWIKRDVFHIDPNNPDPGRVTIRRLNRVEYRNTIRDRMGFDFKVEDELPPDDTGYGFDNIGDVLSISPLLLEKYMQAAEVIVAGAVPRMPRVVAETAIPGSEFRRVGGKGSGERVSFYDEAKLAHTFKAEHAGDYRIVLEVEVLGQFETDPGTNQVTFKADDKELWQHEFSWEPGKKFKFEMEDKWDAGDHPLTVEMKPFTPVELKKNTLDLRITTVRVQGPTEEKYWVRPKNFELFFTQEPPQSANERRIYAREILSRFTRCASSSSPPRASASPAARS